MDDDLYQKGRYFYHGTNNCIVDYNKALHFFTLSSEKGSADAQCALGAMYYYGKGVKQNFYKSFQQFSRASNVHHPRALYNLGVLYLKGEGVSVDKEKANELFNRSATLGYKRAFEYSTLDKICLHSSPILPIPSYSGPPIIALLPYELWQHIFSFIGACEVGILQCVSQSFHFLLQNEDLWKKCFIHITGHINTIEPSLLLPKEKRIECWKNKCKVALNGPVDTKLYDLLEVPTYATSKDIKRAYRKQCIKYHPDRNYSKENEKKFMELSTAYSVLSDVTKRYKYDLYGEKEEPMPSSDNLFIFSGHDWENAFGSDFSDNTNTAKDSPISCAQM